MHADRKDTHERWNGAAHSAGVTLSRRLAHSQRRDCQSVSSPSVRSWNVASFARQHLDVDSEEGGEGQLVDTQAERSVAQVPEPVSPRYRNRARKVSGSYRNHSVKHEPELHSDCGDADWRPVGWSQVEDSDRSPF